MSLKEELMIELNAINAVKNGISILDNPHPGKSPQGILWAKTYEEYKKHVEQTVLENV